MRVVNKRSGEPGTYVGRPSVLGNRHPIGWCRHCGRRHDRADCIQEFRRDIGAALRRGDQAVLAALDRLNEDSVLVCWCAPLPCHAEVIARAWAWAAREGILPRSNVVAETGVEPAVTRL